MDQNYEAERIKALQKLGYPVDQAQKQQGENRIENAKALAARREGLRKLARG